MKIVSFRHQGRDGYGVVEGDGIIDVSATLGGELADMGAVLGAGALDRVAAAAKGKSPTLKLADVEFLFPVPHPQKIFCVGRNYTEYHEVQEMGKKPQWPSIFLRFPSSFTAHNQPIIKPKVSDQLDFEGELVAVIGKRTRHISEADALTCVAGYTAMNEGSVRDWQGYGTQNGPGKNFYHSGSIGPYFVTPDEVGDPMNLKLVSRLNGEVMQDSNTSMMLFDLPFVIAHVSKITWLEPGDLIASGSPGGTMIARGGTEWMKPGDTYELEIENVGTLRNPVEAE